MKSKAFKANVTLKENPRILKGKTNKFVKAIVQYEKHYEYGGEQKKANTLIEITAFGESAKTISKMSQGNSFYIEAYPQVFLKNGNSYHGLIVDKFDTNLKKEDEERISPKKMYQEYKQGKQEELNDEEDDLPF